MIFHRNVNKNMNIQPLNEAFSIHFLSKLRILGIGFNRFFLFFLITLTEKIKKKSVGKKNPILQIVISWNYWIE